MIEPCEPRRLLSAALNTATGLLSIEGTSRADDIRVSLAAGKVVVRDNGVARSFDASRVLSIRVDAKAGNDRILIDDAITAPATLLGGAGDDRLRGGGGPDVLQGGAGRDILVNSAGADIMQGDGGIDTADYSDSAAGVVNVISLNDLADDGAVRLIRPDGSKAVFVSEADNVSSDIENILGGDSNDFLYGSDKPNLLVGGGGDDFLAGLGGDDLLFGNKGNDVLNGGAGRDLFSGGQGDDTADYHLETADLSISLDLLPNDGARGEHDWVLPDVENILGGFGNDLLVGSAADNSLDGGEGNDILRGLAGDDFLRGGGGSDVLSGGAGNDTADYHTPEPPPGAAPKFFGVNLSIDGVANDGAPGENDNIQTDIENLIAGDGNDTLAGSNAPNILSGGAGNDVIHGLGGNDTIIGGAGLDSLYGDDGNDLFLNAEGPPVHNDPQPQVDTVDGGAGFNTAQHDADPATGLDFDSFKNIDNFLADMSGAIGTPIAPPANLAPGAAIVSGVLVVTGNQTADTITLSQSGNTITVKLNTSAFTFAASALKSIQVNAQGGDDTVTSADNIILPTLIDGGAGNDNLRGGGGDDTLIGGAGADTMRGGAGFDTGDYSARTAPVFLSLDGSANDGEANERDDLRADVEYLVGGAGNDVLTGSASANFLAGNGGNDTLRGGGGNDTLVGGDGHDSLFGDEGNDFLFNRDGFSDTYQGGAGTDFAQSDPVDLGSTFGVELVPPLPIPADAPAPPRGYFEPTLQAIFDPNPRSAEDGLF